MLPIDLEIIIIFVLCIFQSIFGLGLLLFGTQFFYLLEMIFLQFKFITSSIDGYKFNANL